MKNFLKKIAIKVLYLIQNVKLKIRGYDDYFNFPFDVNLPLNQHATDVFFESCNILDKVGCEYFVCDGTILGIYRDHQFIAHDNDIDVAVFGGFNTDLLIKEFGLKGYKVGRIVKYKNKVQQLIFYSSTNVIFDICFWYDGGDGFAYHFVPEVKKGRKQKISYYKQKDNVEFLGKKVPTHFNIEKWLEEHYGKDWKVPKSVKGDWREDAKDLIE